MSKKLLSILLSELKTVRVICANPSCKTITEMPMEKLANGSWGKCQHCSADFDPHRTATDTIKQFAMAARDLQALQKHVDLEFVLPELA